MLSGRIPVGQEMVFPLEVRNWLLLVECMMRRMRRVEWSGRGVDWVVSDSLKTLKTVLGFIAWRAVTLEAQQGPVDDYSTLLSRCSHDNTRFRLRSLTNIP